MSNTSSDINTDGIFLTYSSISLDLYKDKTHAKFAAGITDRECLRPSGSFVINYTKADGTADTIDENSTKTDCGPIYWTEDGILVQHSRLNTKNNISF